MDIITTVGMLIFIITPITVLTVNTALVKNIPLSALILALLGIAAGLLDFNLGVCVLLAAVPISTALGVVLKKNLSTYEGLLYTVLSHGLSLVFIILYLTFAAGRDVARDMQETVDAYVLPMMQTANDSSVLAGFSASEWESAFRSSFELVIAMHIPVYCLVCGFASYSWARNLAARKNIIAPMRKFSDLELPRNAVTGLMIIIIAGLLCSFIDIPNIDFIRNVLNGCAVVVFAAGGMALLSYVLTPKIRSGFLRGLILAASVIPFAGWGLAFFGILGPMLRLREKINRGDQ